MPFLYDRIGIQYAGYRRPDPRIASALYNQLGDAGTILNIGAGVGSYEPPDRCVTAVEPSDIMIYQRPQSSAPVIRASAESLPFRDGAFDTAMAILTIHHWTDMERGLQEALRVVSGRLILLTWIGFVSEFWLLDYLPKIKETDEELFPTIERLEEILGTSIRVIPIPIPHDCSDGFLCAYWRRPYAYLEDGVRTAISTFSRINDIGEGLTRLRNDLESGAWRRRYRHYLNKNRMDFGYRIVVCDKR